MFQLFKVELQRHRVLATGVAALHLMALYYLYTLGRSVLEMPTVILWLFICMGLSAGFGVFQMALYKRDNDWLYLLHRPLPIRHVFLALILAGWCLVLLATVLPLTAIVLIMDSNALNGIEGRHYQMVPYAALTAMIAYCCGCFAMLSASRLGFLALSMATALVMINVGSAIWTTALLLLLWSCLVARAVFKPDLLQAPRSISALLLTELPIQYGCLWLIALATTLVLALNNTISGKDPAVNPVPGTDNYVWFLPPKDAMQLALDNANHADTDFLRQQVALGETMPVEVPDDNSYPQRNQLPRLDMSLLLSDAENGIVWRFSHGSMLFEGHKVNTADFAGWLGPDGFHAPGIPPQTRFAVVPWASANEYIMSTDDIYQVDWDDAQIHHRYHNNAGDRFNNSLTIGEHTAALLSDDALYLFSTAELQDPGVELNPKARLRLPPTYHTGLRKLFVLPLVDGYLVSALLDHTPFDMAADFASIGRTRLQLYRLRQHAEAELISSMPLPSSLRPWFFYKELVLSPGMRLFTDFVWGLHDHWGPEITLPLFYVRFPPKVLLVTALVCAFSAGVTALLLRRSTLPLRIRLFWIIANGITGFAGLISFIFGHYWRRQDQLGITPAVATDNQKQE